LRSDHSGINRALIPGTIYAYRWWVVNPITLTMHALNGELWSSETTAQCIKYTYAFDIAWPGSGGGRHNAPDPGCTCGIYARYLPTDLDGIVESRYNTTFVPGVVEIKGNVELGTLGLRAEKAKILAFSDNGHPSQQYCCSEIAEKYHVELYHDFKLLVKDYPPSDLGDLIFGDDHSNRQSYNRAFHEAMDWINKSNPRSEYFYGREQRILSEQIKELATLTVTKPEDIKKMLIDFGM